MKVSERLEKLYRNRFSDRELYEKNRVMKVLCDSFFQKYIARDAVVLDLGAGYCTFINNIQCRKKYAVDIREDISNFANPDVEIVKCSSTDLSFFAVASIDCVFMLGLLEHLNTKEEVIEILTEVSRILKPGGG